MRWYFIIGYIVIYFLVRLLFIRKHIAGEVVIGKLEGEENEHLGFKFNAYAKYILNHKEYVVFVIKREREKSN